MKAARRSTALFIGIAVLVTSATAAMAASETPVLTTSAREEQPAAAPGYLTWNQNSTAKPKHYDTFVRPDGGPTTRVNPTGTSGFGSGISGTTLVYQQVSGPSSNLVLDDLTNGIQTAPPAGVNTKFWEWRPSISGDWLLFTRRTLSARNYVDRVILFNMATSESRVLAVNTNPRHYLASAQVSGNYAAWTTCASNCDVYRYDIGAQTTLKLPNPAFAQYDPGVTADGTMYYPRSSRYCGRNSRIIRRDPDGSETTIFVFPSGKDILWGSATTNLDGSDSFYFDRVTCKRGLPSDVYRIDNADTATATATSTSDTWHSLGAEDLPRRLDEPASGTVRGT